MRTRAESERVYRLLVLLGVPLRWWCRLEVSGREVLPDAERPLLVVANHDSMLDPLVIADTLMRAGRPLRFLAMDRLWRSRVLAWMLDGVRQIPVRRGDHDTDAMRTALDALVDGEAVCVFPEGRLSRGERVRAHRGVDRLIAGCPGAEVVLVAVAGGTDLVRFPRRPRVKVELRRPRGPMRTPAVDAQGALAEQLLAEIRERVPPAAAGRHPGRSGVREPGG